MVYNQFLTEITKQLKQQLHPDIQVQLRKIQKNNGIVHDAVTFFKKDDVMSPTIYLNAYYQQYQIGMKLHDIIEDILALYQEHKHLPPISSDFFSEFNQIQNRIVYKVIHKDSNASLLDTIPHTPFLDLSIVYYIYLTDKNKEPLTILIDHDYLKQWNLSVDELHQVAEKNTPLLLPATIRPMKDVMKEIAKINLRDQYQEEIIDSLLSAYQSEPSLYLFSNTNNFYGACCIFYDHVLKNFAKQLNQDLVILPSSIHEVLLIPFQSNLSYKNLKEMVTSINQTEVPKQDQLSDEIYYYSQQSNTITIVPQF